MKRLLLLAPLFLALSAGNAPAHEVLTRYRKAVNLPDIPGYVTLKCDFHIHTVFSDGQVWPTVRSEEAWREGLDAIAITDHIEYQPHKADLSTNHNRGYELANETGKDLGLMVVHGSEITRSMPPGHLNAIFLTNSLPLACGGWEEAARAAHEQGGFIFWNHPGWERQITNGLVLWYPEHTKLLEQGMLQGIEVVNGRSYYPEAHRWAIEKKLAMISNSDIHAPLNLDYDARTADHRPLTLVFARARTPEALKEAMVARRTAVYSADRLIGEEQFLRPIFEKSIALDRDTVTLPAKKAVLVQIANSSDFNYQLELAVMPKGVSAPKTLVLAARATVLLELKAIQDSQVQVAGQTLQYRVTNLLVGPQEPLSVTLPLQVRIAGAQQ